MDLDVHQASLAGADLCARLLIDRPADARVVATLISAINQLTEENRELANRLAEAEDKMVGATT